MGRVFLVDGKRTPIGKFLGSFYEKDYCDVSVQVLSQLLSGINKNDIDMTIIGNVISANMGQGYFRKIAIESGVPIEKPSYGVNMVCGSGMMAIINAFKEIKCGSNLVLAGGIEFMSNIPYATNTYLRLGKKFGNFEMTDLLVSDGLTDSFSGVHMGITAENIARDLNISRSEQDEYSFLAQKRAISAVDGGFFEDEIVPINLVDYKGKAFVFSVDEFPNRNSSIEKISSLKPTFIKNGGGTVTAASSSGINDGAAFVTVASEKYINEKKLEYLAEILDYSAIGCDPQKMGLGPYFAIKQLLNKNNLDISCIDFFEINEAFAAQLLGDLKLLAIEYNVSIESLIEKTNVNGSGLALGHPLGATGARVVVTLAHILKKNSGKYGIASLCVGGGQGVAILLKRI